ncbi:MAG: OmpA family protein [Candidatus Poribacteria bacterium]|jgi:chemotaxis protein MotB|nr:OmpA family protein [Candidatus Poribacteria bacterium]
MKKTFTLSLLSIFVFSVIFAGCGWIKTEKEFTNWLDGYTDKEGQAHEGFQSKIDKADQGLSDRISELDGKVNAQNEALSADIQQSKEAAIAAAEQGDADTIDAAQDFAQGLDAAVREELAATAKSVGDKALKAVAEGDEEVLAKVGALNDKSQAQAEALDKLEAAVADAREGVTANQVAIATKVETLAVVGFSSGGASLNAEAKAALDTVVEAAQSAPADATILVVGHADGTPVLGGRYRSNWGLSQARADAAAKYLKDNGVSHSIESVGKGHTDPVASVNTKAGRAANRRVEVILQPAG